MRFTVLAIGKVRDRSIVELCETYTKRSQPLIPIERIEVRDTQAAWSRLERKDGPSILLDERGTQLTTNELSQWVERWREQGTRTATFIIGDAHGFNDTDRERADHVLALSRLTLPHRLAHVLMCEQLYRVATILHGHPYHHA